MPSWLGEDEETGRNNENQDDVHCKHLLVRISDAGLIRRVEAGIRNELEIINPFNNE